MTMTGDKEELCKIITVCKIMGEKLSPSEMAKLISLIQDFDKHRISHIEFRKSLQLLFAQKDQKDGKTQQEVEDTEPEEGEIRQYHLRKIYDQDESNHLAIMARRISGDSKKHGHPKIGADLQARVKADGHSKTSIHGNLKIRVKAFVSDKRESEKYVTNVFSLEGKKRRILQSDTSDDERSLKKARTSKRLEGETPSYELIPEEAQCPVKDTVLNNKYRLKSIDNASGHSRLTKYQVKMAICEDEMFETDMLMAALRSAMETAEKVIKGEMRLGDVGVKFYRCIDQLYGGRDMAEIVREDPKKALPLFLGRLKQKLDELTSAKEMRKPGWKKVFEENTAKQRKLDCKSKRPKENNKF